MRVDPYESLRETLGDVRLRNPEAFAYLCRFIQGFQENRIYCRTRIIDFYLSKVQEYRGLFSHIDLWERRAIARLLVQDPEVRVLFCQSVVLESDARGLEENAYAARCAEFVLRTLEYDPAAASDIVRFAGPDKALQAVEWAVEAWRDRHYCCGDKSLDVVRREVMVSFKQWSLGRLNGSEVIRKIETHNLSRPSGVEEDQMVPFLQAAHVALRYVPLELVLATEFFAV
jgi:hypothetical protein